MESNTNNDKEPTGICMVCSGEIINIRENEALLSSAGIHDLDCDGYSYACQNCKIVCIACPDCQYYKKQVNLCKLIAYDESYEVETKKICVEDQNIYYVNSNSELESELRGPNGGKYQYWRCMVCRINFKISDK